MMHSLFSKMWGKKCSLLWCDIDSHTDYEHCSVQRQAKWASTVSLRSTVFSPMLLMTPDLFTLESGKKNELIQVLNLFNV